MVERRVISGGDRARNEQRSALKIISERRCRASGHDRRIGLDLRLARRRFANGRSRGRIGEQRALGWRVAVRVAGRPRAGCDGRWCGAL